MGLPIEITEIIQLGSFGLLSVIVMIAVTKTLPQIVEGHSQALKSIQDTFREEMAAERSTRATEIEILRQNLHMLIKASNRQTAAIIHHDALMRGKRKGSPDRDEVAEILMMVENDDI